MSDEVEYGMVMPFVSVASKGGPHDDEAYVAGYEMGLLDESLRVLAMINANGPIHKTIHESNQEQADLVAMRHGFAAEFAPSGEGWLAVVLSPAGSSQP